jgi:superoxide dismutase, Cu-Zn family
MFQRKSALVIAAAALAGLAAGATGPASAQAPAGPGAAGEIIDSEGQAIGSVNASQLANGLQIIATAENLPAGVHGFHIHAVGRCDPPDFQSAEGHFNPDDGSHGFHSEGGPHAGDLPNVHIGDDGVLAIEFVTDRLTLEDGDAAILDDDGAALVLHANADDYVTDPSGESGGRIACAVIQRQQ